MNDISGILIVDKDKGMTSHDVVSSVRRRLKIKKVGHAGTLDPNATGVLVLLVGKATKLSGQFISQDKEYEAVMKLGQRTDTCDCEGKIIAEKDAAVPEKDIKAAVAEFTGEIEQMPPMFSAKKIKGKKLYELARKGIQVERRPNKVLIKSIDINEIDLPFVRFRVVCTKGTYIRQLVDDIGQTLGCGAHLSDLRRTRSGDFDISRAFSLNSISHENITRL